MSYLNTALHMGSVWGLRQTPPDSRRSPGKIQDSGRGSRVGGPAAEQGAPRPWGPSSSVKGRPSSSFWAGRSGEAGTLRPRAHRPSHLAQMAGPGCTTDVHPQDTGGGHPQHLHSTVTALLAFQAPEIGHPRKGFCVRRPGGGRTDSYRERLCTDRWRCPSATRAG